MSGGGDEEVRAKVGRILEQRYGSIKLIPVGGCRDYLIVKTGPEGAAEMRGNLSSLEIGGKPVGCLRTSGCIGKLKRLAKESAASAVAEVHE